MLRMMLISVAANRHAFDGRVRGESLRFLLSFDNGRSLRLAVAGDGSRMLADDLPLDAPFDMGKYGSIVVEDVTDSLDPGLRAAEVKGVRVLLLGARQVGVQILLGDGEAFHFWVEDDALFWGDEAALTSHDWLDDLIPTAGMPIKI